MPDVCSHECSHIYTYLNPDSRLLFPPIFPRLCLPQNPPLETGEEVSNQTINFETDFTILATQLKEIKLPNTSSSTMEYISQTRASLEKKRNDILQQQQILNDRAKQCRTIDVDVSKQIENAKTLNCTIKSEKVNGKLFFILPRRCRSSCLKSKGRIIFLQQNQTSPSN
jgi:hypothetical protein